MEHYIEVGLQQWEDDVRNLTEDTRRNHLFEWQEVPTTGFSYSWTRRIGDLVWVRIADVIPPNVDQIPRSLPVSEETQELLFDPPRTTTWTVPVDDTNTITASFAYFPETRAERRREGPLPVHGRNQPDADLRGPAAAAGRLGGAAQPAADRGARAGAPGLVRHRGGDVPQGDPRWHPRGQPGGEPDARAARRERGDPHPRAEHDPASPPAPTLEADRELLRETARRVLAASSRSQRRPARRAEVEIGSVAAIPDLDRWLADHNLAGSWSRGDGGAEPGPSHLPAIPVEVGGHPRGHGTHRPGARGDPELTTGWRGTNISGSSTRECRPSSAPRSTWARRS